MSDWQVVLLDLNLNGVGTIETASGGSMAWDAENEVQGRASLTVTGSDIDWLQHRVRIVRDGQPVFTGLVISSPEDHDDGLTDVSLSLQDTSAIVADPVPFVSGVPAGADPLERAAAFLDGYGLPVILPEGITVTLPAAITWPANTTNLTRVNDLLKAAGCSALRSIGTGALQSDPLLPIESAPVAAKFTATDDLYLPQWRRDRDVYKVPNRVTATMRMSGSDDEESVSVDLPATSDYSFEQTGRRVVKDMGDQDAANLTILAQIAQFELESSQGAVETREITHEWKPGFRVGSVAEHYHHEVPVLRSRAVSMSVQMDNEGLCVTTLQGVS